MSKISPGNAVSVVDRQGRVHRKVAISPLMEGMDFEVIWVCRPEEWESAAREGRKPEGIPWPAEDVTPA